jgi:Ca2+-binding RTX toxin-like protein
VQGNPGNDTVRGDWSPEASGPGDVLRGDDGTDYLRDSGSGSTIDGGGGPDTISDESCGKSTIHGGAGNDSITSYEDDYNGYTCDELNSIGDLIYGDGGVDHAWVEQADRIYTIEYRHHLG